MKYIEIHKIHKRINTSYLLKELSLISFWYKIGPRNLANILQNSFKDNLYLVARRQDRQTGERHVMLLTGNHIRIIKFDFISAKHQITTYLRIGCWGTKIQFLCHRSLSLSLTNTSTHILSITQSYTLFSMNRWIDGRKYKRRDGLMDEWIDIQSNGWMGNKWKHKQREG